MRRTNFWTGLAGVIVGALMVTALPAIAQDAETTAVPGDNMKLGVTNTVNNANTVLRGTNSGSNLVVRNTGTGVPLNLINAGNGEPPMKVDSRRLVRNLNSDQIDFRHANELVRAAFDAPNVVVDGNGDAASVSITAPRPGILIMGGSVDAFGFNDQYRCELTVNGATVPGTLRSALVSDNGLVTSNVDEDCATDGGQVVGRGTYDVALTITEWDSAILSAASVWVIWVPFDGEGNVPSP